MASTGNAPAGAARAVSKRQDSGAGSWRAYWPPVLIALAFMPLLVIHARVLWARPHYQFFPLVIPGAVALAYRYCRRLGPLSLGPARLAVPIATVGWGLLLFGVVFVSHSAALIGGLLTLFAAILAIGGWPLMRAALPAWAFLWLAVPLPRGYDLSLVSGLQDLVSRWSSHFLDAFKVYHVMEGNVVEIVGRRLLVDQACSGVYSLLTLLIGALFYALWTRTGVLRCLMLMAAAVFWVLLGNVTRVVTIVVIANRWGIDASAGKKHEVLGISIFILMLLMVGSTDRLFCFFGSLCRKLVWLVVRRREKAHPRLASKGKSKSEAAAVAAMLADLPPAPTATDKPAPTVAPLPPRTVLPAVGRTWLGSAFSGLAFGILLLPQYLMPGINWREILVTNDVYGKPFQSLVAETLPAHWQSFERLGFRTEHRKMDDSWGENSRVWYYRQGQRGVALSADYQFVDWHELSICYISQGWQVTGRRLVAPGDAGPKILVVVDMINPQGWYGMLVYGMYRVDGTPVSPPEATGYVASLAGRLAGWFRKGARNEQTVARLNHQLQLFVESESPLSPTDRDQVLAFYDHARRLVQKTGLGVGEEDR
jgi:exosortase